MEEKIYIPNNTDIKEQNIYVTINEFCELMRKYKDYPNKILFLANMLEQ
jgi:hypothetical protein